MRIVDFYKRLKKDSLKMMDAFFLFSIFFIMGIGFLTIFLEPKDKSSLENRGLKKFSLPTISTFFNGQFQDNLESAYADQFPYSRKIKSVMGNVLNFMDYRSIPEKICQNRYVAINEDHAIFNCADTILQLPIDAELYKDNIANHLSYYNELNALADTYYYVLERSNAYNFEEGKLAIDVYDILSKNLKGNYHIAKFDHNTFEEVKKYFYKGDHHWNLYGSYLGYLEIMKMLKPSDTPLVPTGIVTVKGQPFVGSNAKETKQWDISEPFQYYTFSLPEHVVYVEGKLQNYGNYEIKSNNVPYFNYYSKVYGNDVSEIMYDFNQDEKENLMILASSYSNPINRLIASHFNQTFVVDMRFYNKINFEEYVKAHHITKILVLASTEVVAYEDFNRAEVE